MFRWVLVLGAAAALVASSCTLDRSGGLPSGAGGSGNTGAGGQGGGAECNTIDDCPVPTTLCQERSCAGGWCGLHDLMPGSECHEDGGQVCDGEGHCVKTEGVDCGDPDECLSGHCTDGVCCDAACDRECESCDQGDPFLGVCRSFGAGNDPDGECGQGTCDGASDCANGGHVFSNEYGDSGTQWSWSIATGPSDEILVGGYFADPVDFGGGERTPDGGDAFVWKLDSAGVYAWDLQLGASDEQHTRAVAVDSQGNVIACGQYAGFLDLDDGNGAVPSQGQDDIFLLKLDPDGNHLWSHRFGDFAEQTCRGVAVDSQDNIIIIAELHGSAVFGLSNLTSVGSADVVIAKFDDTGVLEWVKQHGDLTEQIARDVAVDTSDRIVVVGDFLGEINFGGATLSTSFTYRDIFVARFDPGGGHLYSAQFGDQFANDYGEAVAVDQVHHIVIGGDFAGAIDFGGGVRNPAGQADGFVARLDGSGLHQWDKVFGDPSWQGVRDLSVDHSNNVIITGEFYGQANFGGTAHSAGSRDVFLAKYAANGTHLWSSSHGDGDDQFVDALATNSLRQIIVGGHFDGTIGFGGLTLNGNGADLYLAILEP